MVIFVARLDALDLGDPDLDMADSEDARLDLASAHL